MVPCLPWSHDRRADSKVPELKPTNTASLAVVKREEPPGPKGVLYFGCLREMRRNPMRFFTTVAQTYGGIARIPLMAGTHVYLVSEPALLHELLITNRDKYMKNVRYRQAQDLMGLGLLLSEGDTWKHQRLMLQPAFKPGYVYNQIDWMVEAIERFLDGWEPRADTGKVFDVEPDFCRLAQLLAGEMILGLHFREIADRFCEHAIGIKQSWPTPPRGLLNLVRPPPLIRLARLRKELTRLNALTHAFLAERRKHDFEDSGIATLLARASAEAGEPLDDRELRDQTMTLFFAGHETSATALCWLHYLLSLHPAVRDRLQREVNMVIGARRPGAEDIPKLSYTEQVINESLRLYSPIHCISRVAMEDNMIGGYYIRQGSTVVVSMYATHRLPSYWLDPERFDPNRFAPERLTERPSFAFLPFAVGHRNCIGGNLAMIELKLIVACLARRYRLDVMPGHPIEPQPGTTMCPRYGMKMTVQRTRIAT